jgi:hypothetical protein
MRRICIALAITAFSLPSASTAADLSTIDCVVGKLNDTVRAQVEKDVVRNLTETGKKHSYDPSVTTAVRDATIACANDHAWSAAARRPAMLYTLAKLGLPVAQRIATERGLDPAVLEEAWLTLPEDTRNKTLTTDSYKKLGEASLPGGEAPKPETAEFVGEFFGFLSLIQSASFDFSQA